MSTKNWAAFVSEHGRGSRGAWPLGRLEAYPPNVNREFNCVGLEITDMRIAVLRGPGGQAVRRAGRREQRGRLRRCERRGGRGGPPGDRMLLRLPERERHLAADHGPDRHQSGNFGLRPDDRGRAPAKLRADA